jgi:hypothetical protein
MNAQNRTEDRDEVLFAFHQAYERPTADQIVEWVNRYPEFADDIRAHAAVAWDWAARSDAPVAETDATMLSRAYSNALNALHNAETKLAAQTPDQASQTFHQILTARGKTVPALAREIDIDRSVLADLFNGGMLAPVGKRLVNALLRTLSVTRDAFEGALLLALASPRLGHAKANTAPIVIPRAYAEIIRDSAMTPERKRYWLEED